MQFSPRSISTEILNRVDPSLLPDDLVAAHRALVDAKLAQNKAMQELGRAQEAVPGAIAADARALADSIAAGDDDPGPTNATAAHARVTEATRQVAAADLRVIDLENDLYDRLRAVSRTVAEEIDEYADEARGRAREAIAALRAARDEAVALRTVASYLSHFPEHVPLHVDQQSWGQAITATVKQLDQVFVQELRPGPAETAA
jgi:hypothetical protein